ncbi:MAG TPA: hypothetical protein VGZ22_07440, partial [Isosphaeraceae bacterium]|nr:hypothetical protein [Isosphaeraceae bacterium]
MTWLLFLLRGRRVLMVAAQMLAGFGLAVTALAGLVGDPDEPKLPPPATAKVDYLRYIRPILARNCYEC